MNVVCILAGGSGNRFGSPVPKQYHLINGRPVIEYVIDAAIKSQADEVIVASDAEKIDVLEEQYGVVTFHGGRNRNQSIGNALNFVTEHYDCGKFILVDAVCPLVRTDLFDQYFELLDDYDAILTTCDVSTSLARKDGQPVNRKDYFLIESPDAYRFDLLRRCFAQDSSYTTPLHMLPEGTNIKFNYGFKDYLKIMYPHDLAVAKALMEERERHVIFEAHANDAILNLFAKLRKMDRHGTRVWERQIDQDVERLFTKWVIYEFVVNRDAYTGIVLECRSRKYGDVVLKMYPPFLSQRYVKESFIMSTLKEYPQAPLLAVDEKCNAMLLGRVIPGDYIEYITDQTDIAVMFKCMQRNRLALSDVKNRPNEIKSIIEQMKDEFLVALKYNYYPGMIQYLFDCAKDVYAMNFSEEEKFLLHGDAYYKNTLRAQDGIRVIDPVGYVDAFVFEYMPFLTYELVMHTKPEDYLNQYREFVHFFSSFTDTRKFSAATFVFLVKQLVPSIYEANDEYKRANRYLSLIKELFLNKNNEFVLNKYGV